MSPCADKKPARLQWTRTRDSLHFFLNSGNFNVVVGISGYFSFVTKMMLLFGAGFEFPLLIVMLNLVGLASGKRLLGWWH